MKTPDPTTFKEDLLAWYDRGARSLPWRIGPERRKAGERPDPYRVWLSEIMLQQTTVAAVKAYFERFVRRWPTVQTLASAKSEDILAEWAGLGYYTRARNLIACAAAIASEHDGRFPETAAALKALPGIGDYTSAAIAAIAFDEAAPVVDGNVERVVARLWSIGVPPLAAKRDIRAKVEGLTPAERPGDFAQAMMDLGATMCTPRRPNCLICPVAGHCSAGADGTAERFPVRKPKPERPARRGAAFVAVRRSDGAVWLRRREAPGLLSGMSEPPTTAWSARGDGETGLGAAPFAARWRHCGSVAHGFTHFTLELQVFAAPFEDEPPIAGWWSAPMALKTEALPTLMRKVLSRALA